MARTLNIPILVTGGAPDRTTKDEFSEAQVMAKVLRQELGINARWIEDQLNTTEENLKNSLAILSRRILKKSISCPIFSICPELCKQSKQLKNDQQQDQKEGFKPNPTVEQKRVNIAVIAAPHGYYQKRAIHAIRFLSK